MIKKSICILSIFVMMFVVSCSEETPVKLSNTTVNATATAVFTTTPGLTPTETIAPTPASTPTPTATITPTPTATEEVSDKPANTTPVAKFKFTKENFPKIDGSTANIPMAESMLKKILNMTNKEIKASKMTEFATTPYAYDNLINKVSDLLLVYEADDYTKQMIVESGVELEYYPIGKDALVFIVNAKNKASSLTETQIQDIYQSKITNWKDINGVDMRIEAFQRPELSGSQALIRKLVMREKEMAVPPSVYYFPEGMGDIVEVLAEHNNSGNAIGYSVYYYAKNMNAKDGLKFIGVNGVQPSNETIKDGTYPYVNEFYVVIRKDEPENSPARKLLQWILSQEGTAVVEEAGYVSVR